MGKKNKVQTTCPYGFSSGPALWRTSLGPKSWPAMTPQGLWPCPSASVRSQTYRLAAFLRLVKNECQSISVHLRTVFQIKKIKIKIKIFQNPVSHSQLLLPLSQHFGAYISVFISFVGFVFSFPSPALSCTSPPAPFPETCDNHCLGNSILPGVFDCLQWMWGHVLCLRSPRDKKWRVECCVWERNFLAAEARRSAPCTPL